MARHVVDSDPSYGEIFINANLTDTVIAVVNTPVKAAGVTSNGLSSSDITLSSGRIQYTGADTKNFYCSVALNGFRIGAGLGTNFTFYIAKNGLVLSKSAVKEQSGTDETVISTQCYIDLATNDYIELWLENNTNIQDYRVENMNLTIISHI